MFVDADSMEDEAEFNWEEYIEEKGGSAAPHSNFKHVSHPISSEAPTLWPSPTDP